MLYSKVTSIEKDSVIMIYNQIDSSVWDRIKAAALFLSDNDLGPKVESINDETMTIVTEKVNVFSDIAPPDGVSAKQARDAIDRSVNKLHDAGWVHGDLAISNIGYRGDLEVIFFDYDTIHRVTEDIPEWFRLWREEFFDETDVAYKNVIEYEKTALYNDWLDF